MTLIVGVAWETVREADPELPPYEAFPAKLAVTQPVQVPVLMPAMLILFRVAWPFALVLADPTGVPFRLNATVCPLIAVPPEVAVSVAERVVVPPYVPDAGATISVVGAAGLTTCTSSVDVLPAHEKVPLNEAVME